MINILWTIFRLPVNFFTGPVSLKLMSSGSNTSAANNNKVKTLGTLAKSLKEKQIYLIKQQEIHLNCKILIYSFVCKSMLTKICFCDQHVFQFINKYNRNMNFLTKF